MQEYLAIIVFLGSFVDLLLILGTNRFCCHPPEFKRTIPAALIGGVHAGACLLKGFSFLGNSLWRLVFLGLETMTAFGFGVGMSRRTAVFLLLRFALTGVAQTVGNRSMGSALLAAGIVTALCVWGIQRKFGGSDLVPVELRYGDRVCRLTALRDSGNLLRDPVTGEQVIIAAADVGETLLGLTAQQLSRPAETLLAGYAPGMRLIPYKTIEQSGSMLLAMRLRNVKIGFWRGSAMVAFAPEPFSGNGEYQMLVGGMV